MTGPFQLARKRLRGALRNIMPGRAAAPSGGGAAPGAQDIVVPGGPTSSPDPGFRVGVVGSDIASFGAAASRTVQQAAASPSSLITATAPTPELEAKTFNVKIRGVQG